jgi:hypothetical protein
MVAVMTSSGPISRLADLHGHGLTAGKGLNFAGDHFFLPSFLLISHGPVLDGSPPEMCSVASSFQ